MREPEGRKGILNSARMGVQSNGKSSVGRVNVRHVAQRDDKCHVGMPGVSNSDPVHT